MLVVDRPVTSSENVNCREDRPSFVFGEDSSERGGLAQIPDVLVITSEGGDDGRVIRVQNGRPMGGSGRGGWCTVTLPLRDASVQQTTDTRIGAGLARDQGVLGPASQFMDPVATISNVHLHPHHVPQGFEHSPPGRNWGTRRSTFHASDLALRYAGKVGKLRAGPVRGVPRRTKVI